MAKREVAPPADDRLVGYFSKHLVPILFTFEKEGQSHSAVMTTFVLSIAEQWFLITAGHCVVEVERATTECGYRIAECCLIDSIGLDARYRDPIPFAYEDSYPIPLSEDKAFDYGVIVLSSYYRQLLEKNNVQPLSEEVWKHQPTCVDFYYLLGVPGELVTVDPGQVEITTTMYRVECLDERPPGFSETDVPVFYGRIELGQGVSSIKGMSGGPIFAFYQDNQGQLRYWLVALQSRWLPHSHYIAACPTKVLGDTLEVALKEWRKLTGTNHGFTAIS
jgi:hypothetical protein